MFYTIKEEITDELIEKKSKFIANLFIIQNIMMQNTTALLILLLMLMAKR